MAVRVDSQGQASWSWSDVASVSVGMDDFTGAGTADNPYQLSTADDLEKLRNLVASGMSMENTYLQMTADITLPKSWKPIGVKKNAALDTIDKGNNLCAFSGIFDGAGHKITVAEGGLPLFGYVRGAEIRNLNIYGSRIAGYGLINNMEGVGLSGRAVLIENVTLLSGSPDQEIRPARFSNHRKWICRMLGSLLQHDPKLHHRKRCHHRI